MKYIIIAIYKFKIKQPVWNLIKFYSESVINFIFRVFFLKKLKPQAYFKNRLLNWFSCRLGSIVLFNRYIIFQQISIYFNRLVSQLLLYKPGLFIHLIYQFINLKEGKFQNSKIKSFFCLEILYV